MTNEQNSEQHNEQDERWAQVREILITFATSDGSPIPGEDRLNAAIERIMNNMNNMNNTMPFHTVNISGRYGK